MALLSGGGVESQIMKWENLIERFARRKSVDLVTRKILNNMMDC
jgi:hypothetical protein